MPSNTPICDREEFEARLKISEFNYLDVFVVKAVVSRRLEESHARLVASLALGTDEAEFACEDCVGTDWPNGCHCWLIEARATLAAARELEKP